MLKITETNRTETAVTLKLEGRVAEEWIPEIETACSEVLSDGFALTLDMSDVLFVERHFIPLFNELQVRSVDLVNCSPYLLEQLSAGD
ncbi:MAG TPA: hypothetical protein VGQ55_08310 [Pyrinomonadaceae bacterium]|jgi:hypothetical protein|nr:hypothetical protein [Pyrinomonadaceae bacterium]